MLNKKQLAINSRLSKLDAVGNDQPGPPGTSTTDLLALMTTRGPWW